MIAYSHSKKARQRPICTNLLNWQFFNFYRASLSVYSMYNGSTHLHLKSVDGRKRTVSQHWGCGFPECVDCVERMLKRSAPIH